MNLNALVEFQESEWLDFKQTFHENNAKLIHDIICLANSWTNNDRYIVFGITDQRKIIGIENDCNRKKASDIQDLLRQANFNRIPSISIQTEKTVENHEVDILCIRNLPEKPYFLLKDKSFQGATVRAGVVYTRIGDTNIPLGGTATEATIELLWRQRFGLDLTPSEKFHLFLKNYKSWAVDVGNSKEGYYKPFPEYQLEFLPHHEGTEPYSYFFPNKRSFFGEILLKYFTTTIYKSEYGFLDEFRYPISIPKTEIRDSDKNFRYYYFLTNSMEFKLFRIFGLKAFLSSLRKECLPFVFFLDEIEKTSFDNYLSNMDIENLVNKGKSRFEFQTDDRNCNFAPVIQFMRLVGNAYFQWKNINDDEFQQWLLNYDC